MRLTTATSLKYLRFRSRALLRVPLSFSRLLAGGCYGAVKCKPVFIAFEASVGGVWAEYLASEGSWNPLYTG